MRSSDFFSSESAHNLINNIGNFIFENQEKIDKISDNISSSISKFFQKSENLFEKEDERSHNFYSSCGEKDDSDKIIENNSDSSAVKIIFYSLIKLIKKNDKLIKVLNKYGINIDGINDNEINVDNKKFSSFTKITERSFDNGKIKGKVITYGIMNQTNKIIKFINSNERKNFLIKNFDFKYDGNFSISLIELSTIDINKIVENQKELTLDGTVETNKCPFWPKMIIKGKEMNIHFLFDKDGDIVGKQSSVNSILIKEDNGEREEYNGNLINFKKNGEGTLKKDGYKIKGNFVNDELIEGIVKIYKDDMIIKEGIFNDYPVSYNEILYKLKN